MAGTIADIADELAVDASAATARGEHESAAAMLRAAFKLKALLDLPAAREVLSAETSSGNLQEMTGAQLQRRGKAIAQAKAAKSNDPLWRAITQSRWGSQERYARERLKVSPGSLSAYRSGDTPCPRTVAALVEKDFGIVASYWKGGVVE